jgi:photosystem II stability/assembly factor-like uncharacterized protein
MRPRHREIRTPAATAALKQAAAGSISMMRGVASAGFPMHTLVKLAAAVLTAVFAAVPAGAGVGAWTSLPGPGDAAGIVNVIAGHPTDATLRYLATQGGMYVSRNAGGTWQLSNSGIAPTPAGYHGVTDLAVTASLVYITPYYLQKSTNGGSAWVRTGWVTENPGAAVLAVDLHNETTVYAGSNRGVYKSSDGGATWIYLAGNSQVYALAIDPGNPSVLFRGVASGIYRTQDGGSNWTQVNSQLSVHTFAFGSADSQTVYAGTNGSGIWRSTDGGSTWKVSSRCTGGCTSASLQNLWVTKIIVAGSTVYAGSSYGLFRSLDGGETWSAANNGPIGVTSMMLDPLNADTIIASYGNKLFTYTFPTASDWDRIFDWAEATYPQFFPGHVATQAIAGYQARYYAGTSTYLGALDGKLYVHGPAFGGLLYVGTTAQLLPVAAAAGY